MARKNQTFSYEEALATLPRVRALTADAVRQIEALVNRAQSREELEDQREDLETATQSVIDRWVLEVTSIGCEVKGLWLVDWDSCEGYYCWRYPEETIAYFHGYEDGFAGRIPIN